MTARNRKRTRDILGSVSVYRRLPTISFDIEPDVYRYFTMSPDVAVSIWRAMKISKFQMWQTGKLEYEADAGDGTLGIIDVLYRDPNKVVILCDGKFKSPLIVKPIRARAVMSLEVSFTKNEEGRSQARHRADLFVSFPSATVGTIAKALSPVSNLIVDHNFREISLFLHMMSLAMAKQPGWVERLADRLDGVRDVRKKQLLKLTAQVYVTARKRRLANSTQPSGVPLEEVIPPRRIGSADVQRTASRDDVRRRGDFGNPPAASAADNPVPMQR